MRSWFGSSSTIISITIKTTDGRLEENIQIQSDETVNKLKSIIDDKFQCDPEQQNLVFHGQSLEDNKPLSDYNIENNSTILLMKTNKEDDSAPPKPAAPAKRRSIFEKANPFYQSNSNLSEPGNSPPNEGDKDGDNAAEGPYFDPILNQLSKYHPELPLAVMEHSKEIGGLLQDVNRRFDQKTDDNGQALTEEEQSLTAYYYYLSLASLSAVTSTVASSVYQRLPSKEQISTTVKSMIRPSDASSSDENSNTQHNTDNDSRPSMSHLSMSWIKHLQKLVTNTKEEKAAIDRLVSLGFDKTESIEAYLACNKDEALAAVFMSQETNKPTKGAPGDPYMNNEDIDEEEDEEEKKEAVVDASMGYINEKHKATKTKHTNKPTKGVLLDEQFDKTIVNKSVYFKQFQKWMRNIFDDDESYYRYLLLFMKEKIADMTCLEDINYDEEFLLKLGIEHTFHRKRLIKAIGMFVSNKHKFEIWWNETIQFKKYLKEFEKNGIWDLEELLLQIRSTDDIRHKIGIDNNDDVEMIWKHVEKLRQQHTLYANIQATGSIFAPQMTQSYMPNVPTMPQAQYAPYPQAPPQPSHGGVNPGNTSSAYHEYNAPPMMYPNINHENGSNNEAEAAEQEGAVTQM